jgi:hypothetical protein
MSPASALLSTLRTRGILIEPAHDGLLRVRGPLTPDDRVKLLHLKPAILDELAREASGFLPCGHRLGPGEHRLAHDIRDAVVKGDDLALARLRREGGTP